MLIRFLRVSMDPTVASGGAAPTQGDEIMWFMQAGVRVASEPSVMDTVVAVADRLSATDAPILVTIQDGEARRLVRLFFTHGEYCLR